MRNRIIELPWIFKLIIVFVYPVTAALSVWLIPHILMAEVFEVMPRCIRPEYYMHMYVVCGLVAILAWRLIYHTCEYTKIAEY